MRGIFLKILGSDASSSTDAQMSFERTIILYFLSGTATFFLLDGKTME